MRKVSFEAYVVGLIVVAIVTTLLFMVTGKPEVRSLDTKDFYRYVDEEMGIVCYVLSTNEAMSCLWLEDEPGR